MSYVSLRGRLVDVKGADEDADTEIITEVQSAVTELIEEKCEELKENIPAKNAVKRKKPSNFSKKSPSLRLSLGEPTRKSMRLMQESLDGNKRKSYTGYGIIDGDDDDTDYDFDDDDDDDDYDDDGYRKRKSSKSSQHNKIAVRRFETSCNFNMWGQIPGFPIGSTFTGRFEACSAGVHRATVAGISSDSDGAYAVSVNFSYDENEDHGWYVLYCGSGGRDLKGTKNKPKNLRTAPQSKDQVLNRSNAAMVKSEEEGRSLRLIRGPKSKYGPAADSGFRYRYDGLYHIESHEQIKGKEGFKVFRFRLVRDLGQEPLPFTLDKDDYNGDHQ